MATNRKLCDISGVPFVIEERDGEKGCDDIATYEPISFKNHTRVIQYV